MDKETMSQIYQIRGVVASTPEPVQSQIKAIEAELLAVVAKNGDLGKAAMCLAFCKMIESGELDAK